MKENIEKALSLILRVEGGYVDDPDDMGGETCFGICRKNFPKLELWEITDHLKKIGTPTRQIGKKAYEYEQVKSSVREVYKKRYWDACKCDLLPAYLDIYVFDASVNHGVLRAIKMLQNLLRITQDGIIGKQTLSMAQRFKGNQDRYLEIRRQFYDAIIKNNPKQEKFRKGWYARLEQVKKITL